MVGDLFFWSFCCLRLWKRDKKVRIVAAAAGSSGRVMYYSGAGGGRGEADSLKGKGVVVDMVLQGLFTSLMLFSLKQKHHAVAFWVFFVVPL